ncbi:MAG: DNA primase [Candidatus Omnitrophica bacterium]|nr:DNA primase [Candidatus Omnitrophota bacterium]
MAYDNRIIEQVQSLNDIVDVISSYIPLKRTGRSLKACCPFHQEKTPSFIVNPERQVFHCFGCGEGGDVLSFVMKYEQLTFPEALKLLADRAHFELPATSFQRSEKSNSGLLYQIYEVAQAFYHSNFMKLSIAEKARAYWKSRGFGEKEAIQFGIGFAQDDWRKLFEHLSQKGFHEEAMVRSGLIAKPSSQKTPYDLFRNRLMFPIRNAQGRVIAFGGRVLADEMPKYLNSPETDIFKKRREFYGLSVAKGTFIGQGSIRQIIIVEGYLDCLQLQVHGFLNTVATLGTALTEDHVRILKRYADEAILVYDGDRAGEQAAVRSLDVFLEEDMSAKAVGLPDALDPDDFLRSKGAEAFHEQLLEAQDIFDFKLNVLLGRFNKLDSSGLLKITGEFLDTLAKIKNQVLLDRYLKKLAGSLGVEERSLKIELEKLKAKKVTRSSNALEVSTRSAASSPILPYEKLILTCLLQNPSYLEKLLEALPTYEFENEQAREFFEILRRQISERAELFSSTHLMNELKDDRLKVFATELLVSELPEGEALEQVFQDCLAKIEQVLLDKELKEIKHRIQQAERDKDLPLVNQLLQDYQGLLEGSRRRKENLKK